MDIKQLTRQYRKLNEKYAIIEKARESCKAQIKQTMQKEGLSTITNNDGLFTLYEMQKKEFNDDFKEKIDTLKEKEEKAGRVKYITSICLKWTAQE